MNNNTPEQTSLLTFWDENPNSPSFLKTIDESINNLIQNKKYEINSDILNSVSFKIKIRGKDFDDDFVDINIANYIIQLQQKINDILELNGLEENKILVNVKVEKGCKEIKAFLKVIGNMNSDIAKVISIGIISVGIATPILAPYYFDYLNEKLHKETETLRIKSDSERDTKLIETLDNFSMAISTARDLKSDLEKPMRDILKSTSESDEASINNSPFKKRDDILKELKPTRNPKSEFQNLYIDGKYKITEIDGEKKCAKILINGKEKSISFLDFSKEDTERLITLWGKGGELSDNDIDLQITLECNTYRVKSAKIIGIGTPRENVISPEDIEALK